MRVVVGIDLGTTNSLVAYMKEGRPEVIPDEGGDGLLPSVVSFRPGGVVVGRAAKAGWKRWAAETVYSVKRFMGRGYEDLEPELRLLPFRVSPQRKEVVELLAGGRRYTPPEVSALILRELKLRAERHLGGPVTQAVITVPAYFNDAQRQATKDAGRMAGLEVLRIVNEPTAAALAYGLHQRKEGTIAVYDLGGGTFDISLLKIKEGIFEVLATGGDSHLGGDDFDQALMALLIGEIREGRGYDAEASPEALQELRSACEEAKCRLSFEERAWVELSLPPSAGGTFRRELSRGELEGIIRPLVERTLPPCRQALKDAGLRPEEVDEAVLVGGSTRIPLVRRLVEETFRQEAHCELNPEEVVALGAAVQADILAGGTKGMLLLDVTPLSLGIETMGGAMGWLIPRNSTIPCSTREVFTTFKDNQTGVDIHVLQGERELAGDNRSLARFKLSIEPRPAGAPRVEVNFLIDANGILNVTARDLHTGKAASVEVTPSYGLSEEEVERMIEAGFAHAEEDVRARQLLEARTEAERLLAATERAVAGGARFESEEEKRRVEEALAALREALGGEDLERLRGRIEELNRATTPLAERMMDGALREALQSRRLSEVIEK